MNVSERLQLEQRYCKIPRHCNPKDSKIVSHISPKWVSALQKQSMSIYVYLCVNKGWEGVFNLLSEF